MYVSIYVDVWVFACMCVYVWCICIYTCMYIHTYMHVRTICMNVCGHNLTEVLS
jgi:hypothetical protein